MIGGDLLPVRVWLAFQELALSSAGIAEAVGQLDEDERALLQRVSPIGTTPIQVVSTHALVLGLRTAIVRGVLPLGIGPARDVLSAHVTGLGRSENAA